MAPCSYGAAGAGRAAAGGGTLKFSAGEASKTWNVDQAFSDSSAIHGGVSVTENVTLHIGEGTALTIEDGKTLTVVGPGALTAKAAAGVSAVSGNLKVDGGTVSVLARGTGGSSSRCCVTGDLTVSGGAMATGWKQIGGRWYWFYPNGAMAANTVIDGYELNENGVWVG